VGMAIPMATPAQAIFGLSTCEKVKKQVLGYESQIDAISDYWRQYKGKNIPKSLVKKFNYQSDPENDVVLKLTKIQFNNPKCFTRTQNEEINARKDRPWNFDHFVWHTSSPVLRNLKECEDILEKISPSTRCLVYYKINIQETYSIPTIYKS
jgi:hypothetical protein